MFSEMSYHVWRFMDFNPNAQSHGHIHGIVCSNDLILCTMVHLGIPNNVAKGSFNFLCTENLFSIFRVPEMRFFCEGPTIYLLQNCTKSIFWNTRTYLMHNWPNGWCKKFWSTSGEKDKFLSIQLEAGQVWTVATS